MRRSRITITLTQDVLSRVDQLIDHRTIRNRSHAIEYILSQHAKPRISTAVILAGGQGTNLRPYTYEIPKSLLPVKGKPILEYLITRLQKNGITEIILCVGYLGDKIKEYFKNGEQFGVHITYSEEKKTLQTGGALLKVKDHVSKSPFLVIHGDILTNLSFSDLVAFHMSEQSPVTVAVTTVNHPSAFGQLKLHGTKLMKFYQQSDSKEVQSNLVNCGIYVCDPSIFRYFPANKKTFMLEDVIEELINERQANGFVFSEQWYDVEDPKNYEKAIKEFTS
ncbi:MAG: hypothetical protein RI947_295 [Candidatus Parcubacteria bacterium]|jgi:NDP-sugar pyrophosphorylase family protein